MANPTVGAPARTFIQEGIFSPDSLETNRAGHLTDVQRKQLGVIDRAWRKNELIAALGCAVVSVLLITSTGPAPNAALRPIAAVGLLVAAAALVLHSMPGSDKLAQDIKGDAVTTIEGAMEKHSYRTSSGGSSLTTHYLDIADQHFEVSGAEYQAAPSAGYVRLFYLARSRRVVNLERLPDPPLPAGVTDAPMETLKAIAGSLLRSKGEAHHEAAAELAQLGSAFQAMRTEAAVPPGEGERDPRPLAEAIVGTWRAGPMSVTFGADGTIEYTGPGGIDQRGHWSVDAEGHLHADALGGEQAGDAWVSGDTLTLAAAGEGFRLKRVAGG